jgi:hypothetical protein
LVTAHGLPVDIRSGYAHADRPNASNDGMCALHTTGVLNCKQLPDNFTCNETSKTIIRKGFFSAHPDGLARISKRGPEH